MTRKDYEVIAAALREARERCANIASAPGAMAEIKPGIGIGVQIAAEVLADALAEENPRFNHDLFDLAVWGPKVAPVSPRWASDNLDATSMTGSERDARNLWP